MDRFNPEARSRLISSIHGKDTKPEMVVRRLLHTMGYCFRLHRRDLPGTPDILLPGRRAVMFVHGCSWHRHEGCRLATVPATRRDFWEAKIAANKARDRRAMARLRRDGWRVAMVWERRTRKPVGLHGRLRRFLERG
jgi:DNA mismatch endonuclease (patch repair protein)